MLVPCCWCLYWLCTWCFMLVPCCLMSILAVHLMFHVGPLLPDVYTGCAPDVSCWSVVAWCLYWLCTWCFMLVRCCLMSILAVHLMFHVGPLLPDVYTGCAPDVSCWSVVAWCLYWLCTWCFMLVPCCLMSILAVHLMFHVGPLLPDVYTGCAPDVSCWSVVAWCLYWLCTWCFMLVCCCLMSILAMHLMFHVGPLLPDVYTGCALDVSCWSVVAWRLYWLCTGYFMLVRCCWCLYWLCTWCFMLVCCCLMSILAVHLMFHVGPLLPDVYTGSAPDVSCWSVVAWCLYWLCTWCFMLVSCCLMFILAVHLMFHVGPLLPGVYTGGAPDVSCWSVVAWCLYWLCTWCFMLVSCCLMSILAVHLMFHVCPLLSGVHTGCAPDVSCLSVVACLYWLCTWCFMLVSCCLMSKLAVHLMLHVGQLLPAVCPAVHLMFHVGPLLTDVCTGCAPGVSCWSVVVWCLYWVCTWCFMLVSCCLMSILAVHLMFHVGPLLSDVCSGCAPDFSCWSVVAWCLYWLCTWCFMLVCCCWCLYWLCTWCFMLVRCCLMSILAVHLMFHVGQLLSDVCTGCAPDVSCWSVVVWCLYWLCTWCFMLVSCCLMSKLTVHLMLYVGQLLPDVYTGGAPDVSCWSIVAWCLYRLCTWCCMLVSCCLMSVGLCTWCFMLVRCCLMFILAVPLMFHVGPLLPDVYTGYAPEIYVGLLLPDVISGCASDVSCWSIVACYLYWPCPWCFMLVGCCLMSILAMHLRFMLVCCYLM